MRRLEYVIPIRPVPVNAADRAHYQGYMSFVRGLAQAWWGRPPESDAKMQVSIVYWCDELAPIDVDNIIKPILDAMKQVVYVDDVLVTDCDSHRRYIQNGIDLTNLPRKLVATLVESDEAVYIRVRNASDLANQL